MMLCESISESEFMIQGLLEGLRESVMTIFMDMLSIVIYNIYNEKKMENVFFVMSNLK